MDISIKVVQGFTKDEAFSKVEKYKSNIVSGSNCTKAWIAAGSPVYTSDAFKQFCIEQLSDKTKLTPGLGCYIILEQNRENKRERPVGFIKLPRHKGKQTYKVMHQINEALFKRPLKLDANGSPEIVSIGNPICQYPRLDQAIENAKQYTVDTSKDCIIQKIKVPEYSQEFYSYFQPSKYAKCGTFITFGINRD